MLNRDHEIAGLRPALMACPRRMERVRREGRVLECGLPSGGQVRGRSVEIRPLPGTGGLRCTTVLRLDAGGVDPRGRAAERGVIGLLPEAARRMWGDGLPGKHGDGPVDYRLRCAGRTWAARKDVRRLGRAAVPQSGELEREVCERARALPGAYGGRIS